MGICVLGVGDCGGKKSITVSNDILNNVNITAEISQNIKTGNTTTANVKNITSADATIGSPADCVKGLPEAVQLAWINAMKGQVYCNDISIKQDGTTNITITSSIDEKILGQMSSSIQSEIANKVSQDLEQATQEDLNILASILGSDSQKESISNNISNSVNESIKQNFTLDTVNNVLSNTLNVQKAKLVVCAPVRDCEIEQGNIANVQVKNITALVAQCVQSSAAIQKLVNNIDTIADQKTEGILGGIADIIRQIGTVGVILIVAAGLLVLFGLIVMIMYGLRKKPQTVPQMMRPQTAPQMMRPQTAPQMMRPQTAPQMMRPQTAPQMMRPQTVPQMMRPQTVPQMMRPQTAPQMMRPQTAPQIQQLRAPQPY